MICYNFYDYLKLASRQFAALAAQPIDGGGGAKYIDVSGAVITGQGGGRIFADKYTVGQLVLVVQESCGVSGHVLMHLVGISQDVL